MKGHIVTAAGSILLGLFLGTCVATPWLVTPSDIRQMAEMDDDREGETPAEPAQPGTELADEFVPCTDGSCPFVLVHQIELERAKSVCDDAQGTPDEIFCRPALRDLEDLELKLMLQGVDGAYEPGSDSCYQISPHLTDPITPSCNPSHKNEPCEL